MTGLPRVKITYANGALGQTAGSEDGLLCLVICGAIPVADKFALNKVYSLRKTTDLAELGITAENNPLVYQTVVDFYAEAEEGTKVHLVGYPDTLKMSEVLDKENPYLRNVIDSLNGALRGLVVTSSSLSGVISRGVDEDVSQAVAKAHELGEWATTERYAPLFTLIDGLGFSGEVDELPDMKLNKYYRSAVVIGARTSGAANQAIGLVAGRLAGASVDKNVGRVADGALNVSTLFAGTKSVELADTETIYEKGYITFRNFVGRAGYFISDDQTCTSATDDYNHLTALRTIDKAYRLAYGVLIERLLDKVEVRSDGTMLQPVIVAWKQAIRNVITSNMTAAAELSNDDNGGVEVYIDAKQDVLATGTINTELRVLPFGYARYINMTLGFTINS